MNLNEFAQRMPKVELHVHLEGSIRPETLLQLADRNHVPLPAEKVSDLESFYRYRDFEHFVEIYHTITRCLQTPEDYHLIAYEFGRECERQNIRYAEVTFTMTTNMAMTGLPWQAILDGLNAGRAQARDEFGLDWRWVFDILRNAPETQDCTLKIALQAQEHGVVALGLGGSEAEFPPDLFVDVFEKARQAMLPRVPHAGETLGPDSIWTAINQLHADRLGHGVRAIEDPKLVETLRQRQIPLEVCPTSNIRLGLYQDYKHHPLRRLWDQGLYITIGSDDPPMFGCDLNHEYQLLVDEFAFNADELEVISLKGLRASFLPDEAKAQMEKEFTSEFAKLRKDGTRI